LTISRPDGTTRRIRAYYQDGFTNRPDRYHLDDDVVISLLCPDPFWQDTETTVISRSYGSLASFYTPYPTVSSSQVLGDTTATNAGDVEAWPSWSIAGPFSSVIATNNTSGQAFTLTPADVGATVVAGQTVTITTDPPAVRGPAGEVWTGALNWPNAVLWGLVPGDNDVVFTVGGAGPETAISLSFTPRYEMA
jgi:hypothetical protein